MAIFGFRPSTFGKVVMGYLALGLVLLCASLFITINLAVRTMQGKIEGMLMSTAQNLAGSSWVVDMLEYEHTDPALSDYLDNLIETTQDISFITVADQNSLRFYHYNKERIGEYFVGGDEERVLRGESYLSNADGTMGNQRRAFAPVYDEGGKLIGFVMVSAMMARLENVENEVISAYLRVTLILVPLAALVAFALCRSIRKELMGYEPDKLIHSFVTRGEVLDALAEGILSVEEDGSILYANQSAVLILGIEEDLSGQNLLHHLDDCNKEILKPGPSIYNREMLVKGSPILYDQLAPKEKNQGYILILRNKNDATRLAEELTGTKHIISALRANTHEFMNTLHVIWGLLSMQKVEEVCSYIFNISRQQDESISPIMQTIENPAVAGLLLGKTSNMREANICLVLNRRSYLPRHSRYLSTRQLVTVVGNLIENAIEAVNQQSALGERSIELQITEDEAGLVIWIGDTGVGMDAGEENLIFLQGYSTKGQGRGTGMFLIKSIIDSCNGTIKVESEKGEGTSISILVNHPRQGGSL
ncbi:MAG: ATP-binding protein [Lachnospiraceae bacterium]